MIKPEHYVNLKGRMYPVYAGVLDCATQEGLLSLTTELVQIPTEENGWMAIVKARAEMKDGRVFQDYGDCSPKNTSAMIATAAIRMASTRAKGRALRDAINLGETLREEMPEELGGTEEATAGNGTAHSGVREQGGARGANERVRPTESRGDRAANPAAPASAAAGPVAPVSLFCDQCGLEVEEKVAAVSQRRWNRTVCVVHGRELAALEKANVPTGAIAA